MIVNTLVFTDQIIKSGVKQGDRVKSINGKSYKNYCELLRYQLLSQENSLTIQLQDGQRLTFKRDSIY
jgi:hypothetical protein